jgi:hypothetical protein
LFVSNVRFHLFGFDDHVDFDLTNGNRSCFLMPRG